MWDVAIGKLRRLNVEQQDEFEAHANYHWCSDEFSVNDDDADGVLAIFRHTGALRWVS